MAESIFGNGMDQWICPNDRQLALRAKLQTGWSVHTFQTEKQRKSQSLNSDELDMIVTVIQRAEHLEQVEQQRIGRLVERLENMRKNMMGNGQTQCLLCGEVFSLFGTSSAFCQGCRKKVCTKCGIETLNSQKRQQWMCKICSEQREVWKRSGAWFYKALPKYILPPCDNSRAGGKGFRLMKGDGQQAGPTGQTGQVYSWTKTKVVYSDSDSDSEKSSSSLEERSSVGPQAVLGGDPPEEPGEPLRRRAAVKGRGRSREPFNDGTLSTLTTWLQ